MHAAKIVMRDVQTNGSNVMIEFLAAENIVEDRVPATPKADQTDDMARSDFWWNGQTLNTALRTLLFGKFAGKDEFGNRYYRTRKIDKTLGFERRWVIYAGESEGSMTPPGWYGWLHHTVDIPPTQEEYAPRAWELPHQPNLTGTPQAWRPPGSTLAANARPPATGDYEAWTPEG